MALCHVSWCKSLSPQVYYDAWWANRNWTNEAILWARLLMRSPLCPFSRLCYWDDLWLKKTCPLILLGQLAGRELTKNRLWHHSCFPLGKCPKYLFQKSTFLKTIAMKYQWFWLSDRWSGDSAMTQCCTYLASRPEWLSWALQPHCFHLCAMRYWETSRGSTDGLHLPQRYTSPNLVRGGIRPGFIQKITNMLVGFSFIFLSFFPCFLPSSVPPSLSPFLSSFLPSFCTSFRTSFYTSFLFYGLPSVSLYSVIPSVLPFFFKQSSLKGFEDPAI